jgi:hypothetical protein
MLNHDPLRVIVYAMRITILGAVIALLFSHRCTIRWTTLGAGMQAGLVTRPEARSPDKLSCHT